MIDGGNLAGKRPQTITKILSRIQQNIVLSFCEAENEKKKMSTKFENWETIFINYILLSSIPSSQVFFIVKE